MRHPIYDSDPHFTLEPDTRTLVSSMRKVSLIKGDVNSERFTFDLPAEIEGHRLEDCDQVEVHFINIDQATKAQSRGAYPVDDLQAHPDDPSKVTFSWLIDGRATKYQGSLSFVVRIACVDGSVILYAWHTAVFSGISIADGLYNGDASVEEHLDQILAWEAELKANQIVKLEQTQTSTADGGENVWTATFGDGRTQELKVKNGSRGPTGLVGSIETVTGERLQFFAGTRDEYDMLPEEQRTSGMLAVISDDTTLPELIAAVSGLIDGTIKVPSTTNADHAVKADFADSAVSAQRDIYGKTFRNHYLSIHDTVYSGDPKDGLLFYTKPHLANGTARGDAFIAEWYPDDTNCVSFGLVFIDADRTTQSQFVAPKGFKYGVAYLEFTRVQLMNSTTKEAKMKATIKYRNFATQSEGTFTDAGTELRLIPVRDEYTTQ